MVGGAATGGIAGGAGVIAARAMAAVSVTRTVSPPNLSPAYISLHCHSGNSRSPRASSSPCLFGSFVVTWWQ